MTQTTHESWNRCDICGQFIAFREFDDGTATRRLVYPDAYGFTETWDTYHNRCEAQSEAA